MKSKITAKLVFIGLTMLTATLSSCESDSSDPQTVKDLKGWTLQAPDTVVFTELNQTVTVPYKVVDKKGREVEASVIHLAGYTDSYTVQDDQLTISYLAFERQAVNKTIRTYCYLNEGTVSKDIYYAFRPDLSASTPTHPHIYVEKPGTLESYIDPNMEKEITGLTLYGLLNTVDQIYLRKLLGAPETFEAWSAEVGMDVLDQNNNYVILPKYDDFYARVQSQYKLSFLDIRNVVYRSVDEPDGLYFFWDYKVTDQWVKEKNLVRYLFYCCCNLKEIYLPRWYEGINSCVFDMCGRLETVHYPDKLEEYGREITTARHFNDFQYCPYIRTFDLGEQTTNYRVDEDGNLWQVDCNGLLICSKQPNRKRVDLPVGVTLFAYSAAYYPSVMDLYVHETVPAIYNNINDYSGTLNILVSGEMNERITFHVPQGYLEQFKARMEYQVWSDLKIVDDVTDFVVTDSAATKATLRATEPTITNTYRIIHANE